MPTPTHACPHDYIKPTHTREKSRGRAALRGWRRHRAVPRRAKQMAVTGMTAGYVLFELAARPPLWLAVVVALLLIACAAWLISRPTPPSVSETCP